MTAQEISEEQRDRIVERMINVLGLERKHPTKKELEEEIIDYLGKKHPCALGTCGRDGVPRISMVDYMNDGLTLYIMSEGGAKFKNIRENNQVAVGIGTSTHTMRSVRGVNMWGTAEIFTDEAPEFGKALKLFKPFFDDIEKLIGKPPKLTPGVMKVIRVTPARMIYFHYNKGIGNELWEA